VIALALMLAGIAFDLFVLKHVATFVRRRIGR
jgi:hypothetical protein